MTLSPTAELLTGSVAHRRLRPVEHRFAYRVFFLRLPLTAIESAQNALFSLNRLNLASLHFSDHGARDGTHPLAWVREILKREGLAAADGEVWLHCFPRILGYVFNPVSFWFCHSRDGSLRAVLAEVNNTFGEHHSYLLAHPDGGPIADGESLATRKVFHVSPFFPISGRYSFRFSNSGGTRRAHIDYLDESGPLLLTAISGKAGPLTAGRVLVAFASHPLMTLANMVRIHWQAARLWAKRVPFFSKPVPPPEEVTR
jgi:DUF1365 family protein